MSGDQNSPEASSNPETVYQGRDGYNRMVNEIRESLYKEIPEARGNIEVLNRLNDPQEELKRIAESLNVTVKELQDNLPITVTKDGKQLKVGAEEENAGRVLNERLPDGRRISVVAASLGDKNSDAFTFKDIKENAQSLSHEIFHALDPNINLTTTNDDLVEHAQESRRVELFAESGAQAIFMENGSDPNETRFTAAGYDASRMLPIEYDNGVELAKLANRYDSGAAPGITNFNFSGWKKATEIAQESVDGSTNLSKEALLRDMNVNEIYKVVEGNFIETIIYDSDLDPEAMEKEFGPEWDKQATTCFYNSSDLKDNPSQVAKDLQSAANAARQEYHQWLNDRQDYIPHAGRVVNSFTWMGHQDQSLKIIETDNLPPSERLGLAAMKMQDTGSALDARILPHFSEWSLQHNDYIDGGQKYDRKNVDVLSDNIKNDPDAAGKLAGGVSPEKILEMYSQEAPEPETPKKTSERCDEFNNCSSGTAPAQEPVPAPEAAVTPVDQSVTNQKNIMSPGGM